MMRRAALVGSISLTILLAGCGNGTGAPAGSSGSTSRPSLSTTTTTRAAPQVAPIGTAIHLVDYARGISGKDTWVERATIRLIDVIDPATFASGQLPPPWATTKSGGRWVGMRLEMTNDGPTRFGDTAEPYQPILEFSTDRNFLSPRAAGLPLDIVGCPALNYFLLQPGTTTTGCVDIEIPPGSSLRTLDVVLAFNGLDGDTRPIAEWTLS
jgi:hypothetical protein